MVPSRWWAVLCIVALCSWPCAWALIMTVPGSSSECVMEQFYEWEEEIDVSYEVFGGGNVAVDVIGPNGALLQRSTGGSGNWVLPAQGPGVYSLCLHNTIAGGAKNIGFTFHGHDSDLDAPANNKNVAKIEMVSKVEHLFYQLSDSLDTLKDRQTYMKARQAVHRATDESTRERVMWWSLAEALVLVALGAYQIYAIVNTFEVKRRI